MWEVRGRAEEVEGVLGAFELGVDDGCRGGLAQLVGEVPSLFNRRERVAVPVNYEEGSASLMNLIDGRGAAELFGLVFAERFHDLSFEPSIPKWGDDSFRGGW